MCTLVVRWTSEQDPTIDAPHCVFWGDGRAALLQDYINHRLDTREVVDTPQGLEVRMYPSVVGEVRFDAYARTWFVAVPGQDPISLDLPDRDAPDSAITAALYELPVVYRCAIRR